MNSRPGLAPARAAAVPAPRTPEGGPATAPA